MQAKNGAAVPVCGDGMAVWGWGLVVYFLGDGLGVVVVVYGDGDGVVVIIVAGDDFEDGGGVVGGDAGDGAGCLVDDGGSVDEFVGVLVVDDVFDAFNVVVGDYPVGGHELVGDDGGHCMFLLVVSWGLGSFFLVPVVSSVVFCCLVFNSFGVFGGCGVGHSFGWVVWGVFGCGVW